MGPRTQDFPRGRRIEPTQERFSNSRFYEDHKEMHLELYSPQGPTPRNGNHVLFTPYGGLTRNSKVGMISPAALLSAPESQDYGQHMQSLGLFSVLDPPLNQSLCLGLLVDTMGTLYHWVAMSVNSQERLHVTHCCYYWGPT